MRFGSPLLAQQGTSPTQRIDLQNLGPASPLILPTAGGFYDVSGYSAVILTVFVAGYGASSSLISPDFFDNTPTHSLVGALLTVPQPWRVALGSSGATVLWRTLGPALQINVDLIPGGGQLSIAVSGYNGDVRYDGPYTPAREGAVIGSFSDALAIAGTATHVLDPRYVGPAKLTVYGNLGAGATCRLQTVAGPTLVGGLMAPVPPAGSLGVGALGTVDVWVPPEPCRLDVINGGVAQTVVSTVQAA